jgi:hypothetical protein
MAAAGYMKVCIYCKVADLTTPVNLMAVLSVAMPMQCLGSIDGGHMFRNFW